MIRFTDEEIEAFAVRNETGMISRIIRQQQNEYNLLDAQHLRLREKTAELQARLKVMREALEEIAKWDDDNHTVGELQDIAKQALAND